MIAFLTFPYYNQKAKTGQEEHPLQQIHEKRLITSNLYVKCGTLDAALAEVMKKLAKNKMLRAIRNFAHAQSGQQRRASLPKGL